MKEFYKYLREARKEKQLTQEELAERADISRVMVSRYETGSVIPTVDVLISLADALDVSVDYLLGRSDYVQYSSNQKTSPTSDIMQSSTLPRNEAELRAFILNVMKDCFHFDS